MRLKIMVHKTKREREKERERIKMSARLRENECLCFCCLGWRTVPTYREECVCEKERERERGIPDFSLLVVQRSCLEPEVPFKASRSIYVHLWWGRISK